MAELQDGTLLAPGQCGFEVQIVRDRQAAGLREWGRLGNFVSLRHMIRFTSLCGSK